MSSATADSCNEVSFTYNFNLKWTLNAKQLSDLRASIDICKTVRSDVYQFKSARDLRFYLELQKGSYGSCDSATIKGSKMWSFKLAYAFHASNERAYKINSSQLSFLSSLYLSYISDEESVVVHCLVNACPVHPDLNAKDDEVILQKDVQIVEFDGMSNITIPSDYKNQTVIDFIRRGDMPTFEHYMARDIIAESKKHTCEVLKILCIEYLMSNITPGTFKMILDAAVKYDLRLLERKCIEKITNGSIRINC